MTVIEEQQSCAFQSKKCENASLVTNLPLVDLVKSQKYQHFNYVSKLLEFSN